MTTPRIEEIKEILTDFGISVDPHGYADGDFTESIERIIAYGELERQAGIDEAVEKVKEIKANRKIPYQALRLSGGCPDCGAEVNQSFVDNEFKEAVDQALDDTIKALQDNK